MDLKANPLLNPPWRAVRVNCNIPGQTAVLNPGLDLAAVKGFCLGVFIHTLTADPRDASAIMQDPASCAVRFDSDTVWLSWRAGGWYGFPFKEMYIRNPYKAAGIQIGLTYIVSDFPYVAPPIVGYNPSPLERADMLNLKGLGVGETFKIAETACGSPLAMVWDLSRSAGVIPNFEGGMPIRQAIDRGRPVKMLPVECLIDLWCYNKTINLPYPAASDATNFYTLAGYNVQDSGYREQGGDWNATSAASSGVIEMPFDLSCYVGNEELQTGGWFAAHYRARIPRFGILTSLGLYVPALTNFTHWKAAIHARFEQIFVDPQEYNRRMSDGPWIQYP